jgi:DNA-binding transcriptional LysR family regulator
MSNLIGRLRRVTGDPLFVRQPDGMVPTPFASALIDAGGMFLHQLRELATVHESFDPGTSRRTFVLHAGDYATATIVPPMMKRVRAEAPGVSIIVGSLNPTTLREVLESHADLAIAPAHSVPSTLYGTTLSPSDMVCIASSNHPTIGEQLSLDDFVNAPHAAVSFGEAHAPFLSEQLTDELLSGEGLARSKTVQVPSVLALPAIVSETDLIAVIPAELAARAARAYAIRIFPLPLPRRSPQFMVVWHRRAISDPGSKWLRTVLRTL